MIVCFVLGSFLCYHFVRFDEVLSAFLLQGRLLAARAAKCENTAKCEHLRSDAKASLLGALAIAPSHVSSLRHLARIYRVEGNIPMAEKMLRLMNGALLFEVLLTQINS